MVNKVIHRVNGMAECTYLRLNCSLLKLNRQ